MQPRNKKHAKSNLQESESRRVNKTGTGDDDPTLVDEIAA
jgi:hypothetical protein